jgi:retron-type reverse transcriptase
MNVQELGLRYDKVLKWAAGTANFALAGRNVVRKNIGSAPGLDGMDSAGLEAYIKTHGEELRASLADGSWRPSPLRRGRHLLLVPNLTDRLVLQALLQVLEPLFEKTFSDFSYHRPGKTPEQALEREREYRGRGYGYVLSPFLDRFVDMVDHRVLFKFVKKRIKDQKLLEMLGAILGNSLFEEGELRPLERGIRQAGCLSFLFCNIYLSEFDRRLEEQRCPFTRYGDRYRIYFKSPGEARELLKTSAGYFGGKLKVPVNEERTLLEGPEGTAAVKTKTTVVIYRKTAPKVSLS